MEDETVGHVTLGGQGGEGNVVLEDETVRLVYI